MFNIVKIIGGLIKLQGNSDGKTIGNVQDALKVNIRNAAGNEAGTATDPIFVEFPQNAQREPINIYGTIASVISGSSTTVVTYTVPGGKINTLERISVSGTNIARFSILVNAVEVDAKRTFFGELNTEFNYTSTVNLGRVLNSGDVVTVEVLHNRPFVGDFEGRIQLSELN